MIRIEARSQTGLGFADFLLSGLASCFAAYSTGVGLGLPIIGYIIVAGIVLGTLVSFVVHPTGEDNRSLVLSGVLYTAAITLAVFLTRPLNPLLPEGGFPPELIVAGVLCWMLLAGSFFAWRDSTLLFQAVPSIALFGLVGSWDTFKGSPITFFAFLMCLAMLFARVHGRAMIRQAKASGHVDMRELGRTTWRWMAGPEWALLSAAAIILVSLVGAPLIKDTVSPFTEALRVSVRPPPAVRAQQNAARAAVGENRIGTGPVSPGEDIIFLASLDKPRYMRTQVFDIYDGKSWANSFINLRRGLLSDNEGLRDRAIKSVSDPRQFEFVIELTSPLGFVPVPGEVVALDLLPTTRPMPDGTVSIATGSNERVRVIGGTAIEAKEPKKAANAYNDLVNDFSATKISPKVEALARSVTAGAKTDMEKAMAIKQEIESRCTYDTDVEAVPAGVDAVEHFLFESKAGYCDMFASSMAVMARAVNLPSRYSIGYFPVNNEKNAEGKYVLREAEYHAWCDIFFEGAGWVIFDSTEGAAVAPGSERGRKTSRGQLKDLLVKGGLGVLAAAALGGLVIGLYRRVRIPVEAGPLDIRRQEAFRLYGRFARLLEKKSGRPRRLSQTAYEYFEVVGPQLGTGKDEAQRLNEQFVQTLYGQPQIDDSLLAQLREQLAVVKRALARSSKAQV